MATITSAQNGDWTDTATWVGGVVPTILDDIVLNHLVYANVDPSMNSIADGATGSIVVDTSRVINVVDTLRRPNWLATVDRGVIDVDLSSGVEVTLNCGQIVGPEGGGSFTPRGRIVNAKGSNGELTINATITGAGGTNLGGTYGGYVVYLNSAGSIIRINGSLIPSAGIYSSYFAPIVSVGGGKTIYINGVLEAQRSQAIVNAAADIVIIDGISTSSGTHSVCDSGGTHIISGAIINDDVMAYSVTRMLLAGDVSWRMNTPTIGETAFLYTAGLLTGYPLEAKVEDGTVYGPSNEFEGTLLPVNVNTQQLAEDLITELFNNGTPWATPQFVTAAITAITPAP